MPIGGGPAFSISDSTAPAEQLYSKKEMEERRKNIAAAATSNMRIQ